MGLPKLGYQQVLEEGVSVVRNLRTSSVASKQSGECLTEGWVLRPAKKAYRFSERQKAYFTAKFNIGQSTGRKVDASLVARDMRHAHGSNGERLLKWTEFLTSSYFSCFSCQQTLTHEAKLTAIEDEINFSTATDQVMATVTLQHPIVFDLHNICAMAAEDTLKNLKASLLQVICQGLNLDIPINQFAVKLHTWSCLKKPSVIVDAKAKAETEYWIGDTSQGCGGYSWKFLMGVCRLFLLILTLPRTKKCNFPHPFLDVAFR